MNPDKELDSLITSAFAEAEARIDPDGFVAELARRRRKRHTVRKLAVVMAVTTGGCVALMFLGDAVSILGRRFAFAPTTPGALVACILPLLVVGAVIDALPLWTRWEERPPRPSRINGSSSK